MTSFGTGRGKLRPQFCSQGVAVEFKMSALTTKCNLLLSSVKLWEKFGEILKKNWWSFVENLVKNFEKNLEKFWKQFGKILRIVWWNFERKMLKFSEYIGEILRKIVKFYGKFGGVLGKIWWNFAKNFDEVLRKILMKLLEKCSELLRKIWWNFENSLVKF